MYNNMPILARIVARPYSLPRDYYTEALHIVQRTDQNAAVSVFAMTNSFSALFPTGPTNLCTS